MDQEKNIKPDRKEILRRQYEEGPQFPESERIKSLFPVKAFPEVIQQLIYETNKALNFPIDFMATSILYTASLAIGNTYRVRVKTGWEESAILFIANIGRPNTNKSHPLSFVLKPIFNRDAKSYKEYIIRKKSYNEAMSLTKKERSESGMDGVTEPVWQKFIVDDYTPEVLAEVHKYNKRGIGVYADELAGWYKNFNRYNKGAEQERWLKIWSAKQINIDRKSSEPTLISHPFINVIGNMQTGILAELAKENRTKNGLVDRLLFGFPEKLEKEPISEKEISEATIEMWDKIVADILSTPLEFDENQNPQPRVLPLSKEAWDLYKVWHRNNTNVCNRTKDEALASIYGKFDIHIIRLALILEILYWVCSDKKKPLHEIGVKSFEGAELMVKYFQDSAKRVHTITSNANPLDGMPEYKRRFYEDLPDKFKLDKGMPFAEIHDISNSSFKRMLADTTLFAKTSWGEYEKLWKK